MAAQVVVADKSHTLTMSTAEWHRVMGALQACTKCGGGGADHTLYRLMASCIGSEPELDAVCEQQATAWREYREGQGLA